MIDPRFLAEVKARTSLIELMAPQLEKLKQAGADWRALCPFHHERTPSFYVIEKKAFWYCFGCGERGDCFAWVMKTMNAREFPEAVEYLAARAGLRDGGPQLEAKPIVQRPGDEALAQEATRKIALARDIWALHQPAAPATPIAAYLRGRGIRVALPPTIAYVPRLEHPYLKGGLFFPAMVSPFQSVDRRIVGVECTYLAPGPRGSWIKMPAPTGWPQDEQWKAKIMRGKCRGAAMRLTPAEDVMVLAEGRETALSVLQALYDEEVGAPHIDGEPVGVWACGGINFIGAVILPAGVREVIIAADGDGKVPEDKPGIAQKDPDELLDQAASRHREQGRNVRIARPPKGSDFNDLLPPGAGAAGGGDDDREAA